LHRQNGPGVLTPSMGKSGIAGRIQPDTMAMMLVFAAAWMQEIRVPIHSQNRG